MDFKSMTVRDFFEVNGGKELCEKYAPNLLKYPIKLFYKKSSTDFLIIFANLRKCWKGLLYQAFPAFCVSEDTPHIMAFRSLTWR